MLLHSSPDASNECSCIIAIYFGSISIGLMESLQINEGQFGSLVMTLFLTCCIVQLIIGPLVDKLGYKPVAIVGFIVTAIGMFMLAYVTSYSIGVLACILLGTGAMCLNTV